MAEAIVSIVAGRITDLLKEAPQLLQEVKDEIEQVLTELTRIKTFLPDADSRMDEERIRILLQEVRELAYDAEHVVESFLVKASLSPAKRIQWINKRKFSRRTNDMHRKMSVIYDCFGDYKIRSTLDSPESSNSSQGKLKRFCSFATLEPEIFVGSERDVERLVGHLVDESDDCYRLISICGMGGLGKTTLAQKIYNHPTIKTNFAGLAWVSISQKWQTKQVLQRSLISLIHEKKEQILTWDDDKLVENLLKIQQKQKCLIVLDDIWSKDVWDHLKAAFPAERSLSKLMLTSRNYQVAEHVNPKGFIHQPKCLSAEHSWELLRLKALPRGYYLDNAEDVKRREEIGTEMVRKCAGLPLAIVILGGILVTKPSLREWEKVYNDSLSSLKRGKGLGENQQHELFDILVRSYHELPSQLKPCFLYLGKFNEDEWIDAEKLYQLWIAEGIVLSSDKREGETMMQVAESYLGELVHKSMVQVKFDDSESSLTKYSSCSLHDLMRDLSLSQAKEEFFSEEIDLRNGNDFYLNRSVTSLSACTKQLVVYYESNNRSATSYFAKKPNHQSYRSILLRNVVERGSLPRVLGPHLANFRLLRVLSLENVYHLGTRTISGTIFGTDHKRVIGSLVYLRYLSARKSNLMILPWIQKLVLLQTLNLDEQFFYYGPQMSNNIFGKLAHLCHLYLPEMEPAKNQKLRFDGLSKLVTLVNFNTYWCEVKDLPKLTSLQKLKIRVWSNYNDLEEVMNYLSGIALSSTSCLRYLAIDIWLTHRHRLRSNGDMEGQRKYLSADMTRQLLWDHKFSLQELRLSGKLPELAQLFEKQQLDNTRNIDASSISITTLSLWRSRLKEDPMPVLERIPTLKFLDISEAYEGTEMVCSGMGFPKLTHLELQELNSLEKWRVEEGSMPSLEQLTIKECPKLEELPQGLVFLNFLERLVLTGMPSDFCDRVRGVNGEAGPDFYKVSHIRRLLIHND